MSVSGALFDMVKFNDVSKNVISLMNAETVYKYTAEWAKEYDADFYALISKDPAHSTAILNVDRDTPKPRKDIACWSEVKDYISYYFDEIFDNNLEMPENITADMANSTCPLYASPLLGINYVATCVEKDCTNTGNLTIANTESTDLMVGAYAGKNIADSVTIENCTSTGVMTVNGETVAAN